MADQQILKGTTVLITGGARGLGRAMADALAAVGAEVAVADTPDVIRQAQDDGLVFTALPTDLENPERRRALLQEARSTLGHVDVLINNAGLGGGIVRSDFLIRRPKFWEVDESVFDRFYAVNSTAPYFLAAEASHEMVTRGFGRIINVTTSLDTMLAQGMLGYGGSKASLEAHSAIMAKDLEGTGVTVNVLVPGAMSDTPIIPQQAPVRRDAMLPAERMGPPAVWLVSAASAATTGQRFRAHLWDPELSDEESVARSSAPIAWPGLGQNAAGWVP